MTYTEVFTDAELLEQPMGYWTGAANESIVGHINDRLATLGIAQPHWWAIYRVGADERGLSREELIRLITEVRPYVDASVLSPAVDELARWGWLAERVGLLTLTTEGEGVRTRLLNEVIPEALDQVRSGVTDEEYAQTVRVLRRMIANTGGDTLFAV